MFASELIKTINDGLCDKTLAKLYGSEKQSFYRERASKLAESFLQIYGDSDVMLFSVPGRTEIAGNHTDHNHGKVLAASVDIDILAVAARSDEMTIRVKSEGYREDVIDISEHDPSKVRKNSSGAIIAGIAAYFDANGYAYGGFRACTTSLVASGSGLSSSAAFEVMTANILNYLYNGNKIPPMTLAKAGKYAENVYFGKPCGLMDQAACANGGLLYIDFKDGESPVAEKLAFDMNGYRLFIVNVGASHADLTDEYSAVPKEMKACASLMGKEVLRECDEDDFVSRIPYLRNLVGDRAVMRALHFFAENKRVCAMRDAIKRNDFCLFLKLVTESGNSSFEYLQNVHTGSPAEQALSLALCLTSRLGYVCRVHGGGFAGTIQAYVPVSDAPSYRNATEKVFGSGSCMELSVRPYGAAAFDNAGIYESGSAE